MMDVVSRKYLLIGAVFAFLSVALGAFGAHGLKEAISADLLKVYHTGVEYQMFHAVGILFIALFHERQPEPVRCVLTRSLRCMLFGVLVFCGSLYALALSGMKWLGAITPIGGVAFLLGWGWLIYAIAVSPSSSGRESNDNV